jgi:tubulin-folding cofactor B
MTERAFMEKADVEQLKAYVRSNETGMNRADSTIVMSVSHSGLKITHFMEIRFDLYMSVAAVKTKLCTMCGTSPSAMLLQLRDERGGVLAVLGDDAKMLGFYSPYEGCTLHVIDTDPASLAAGGWLEDTSKVEKYVISDDDYNKRENTYRKFKEAKIAADPEWTLEKEICIRKGIPYTPPPAAISDADYMQAEASGIQARARPDAASFRCPPRRAAARPAAAGNGGEGAVGGAERELHVCSFQRRLAPRRRHRDRAPS